MQIIAISGGSGSGKSTVAYKLNDNYPSDIEVLNLDDYQKFKHAHDLPMFEGKINWDHPDVIRWDDLINDIKQLQKGRSVTIKSWSHRSNPDYFRHGKMIARKMYPRNLLIIEGYMALLNPTIRKLSDRKYYLKLDESVSIKRRNKFIDQEYESNILKPMHAKYVVPTIKYADLVIDVSNLNTEKVYSAVLKDIKNTLNIL